MDFLSVGVFLLSAAVLLGSPGPGIAALMLAGKQEGWTGAQPFFWGLQGGLALISALCALGLAAALAAMPGVMPAMMVLSSLYLIWIAVQIIRGTDERSSASPLQWTATVGLWIGISNPKSLLAFVTLFGSQLLVANNQAGDSALKWILTVLVMIIVDLAWLWFGVRLGTAAISETSHRGLNYAFGLILGCTALIGLVEALKLATNG